MKIEEIEYDDELEQVLIYYNDIDIEEPNVINIDKLGIAKTLGYEAERNEHEECILTVGTMDAFNGDHYEIPITVLLDEWHPSFEELIKFVELYEAD